MRALIAFLVAGASLLIATAEASAQFRPGGKDGGKFGGPGSFGKGSFGDPNFIFEKLANGRPYFLISDSRGFREALTVFAKERGITNEQITREQFAAFFPKADQYRNAASGGAGKSPFGGGPGMTPGNTSSIPQLTPPPGSPPIAPGQNPLEAMAQWAESDFRRRDLNGDGKLTPEEMSENLRSQLERWDTNRDGLISLDEYKVYFSARLQSDGPTNAAPTNPLTVLIEEDYDRRPDVIRFGKLPKELPKWFSELDTDQDGQVALHEWVKAGKDIDEFKGWDRNDDGFVTAEEVLFKQRANASLAGGNGGTTPSMSNANGDRPRLNSRDGNSDTGNRFGGPGGGKGGFFRKKG